MHYLIFETSEGTDGVATLETMASTRPEAHAAVMAEVHQVLDWAWQNFPDQHGPVEDGMAWDHELLVQDEGEGWRTVTLTLSASLAFLDAFTAKWG